MMMNRSAAGNYYFVVGIVFGSGVDEDDADKRPH